MGDMIQHLVEAEKQAEDIIAAAKKNRLTKLRQAKEKAEEELKGFRGEQDAKFEHEMGKKATEDSLRELTAVTQQEIEAVNRDYERNKAATVDFVLSKVLDVPLGLSSTQ